MRATEVLDMKLCKDCAYFAVKPMTKFPTPGPYHLCTKAGTTEPVLGRRIYEGAETVRRDPGKCGPAGKWFIQAGEPAVAEEVGFLQRLFGARRP